MAQLPADEMVRIQQLYARYNHALDAGDVEGWLACWSPDGVMVYRDAPTAGHAALRSMVEATKAARDGGSVGRHWVDNLVVEAAPGGAVGACYLLFLTARAGQPPAIALTGRYRDELICTGGEWRFLRRTVTNP